jgi:hypothetical protein
MNDDGGEPDTADRPTLPDDPDENGLIGIARIAAAHRRQLLVDKTPWSRPW